MIGPIEPFNTIGIDEYTSIGAGGLLTGGNPLSGYLAGKERGGHYVRALEDEWAETFAVKHAIACNSATSGLLAAAFAAGLGPGNTFVCPAMTMSATAAAPMFTGATPLFCDVSDADFAASVPLPIPSNCKAIFITNLFGHPGELSQWRSIADSNGCRLIEDNSQSPFAVERGTYAGTVGHIGVWSLNVHKHIQCGEGGIITTDDTDLALEMRHFINHGENAGGRIGLNLRMPELCAAVALAQLRRLLWVINGRIEQAEAIIEAIGEIPGIRPPVVRGGCRHVYYAIPFLCDRATLRGGKGRARAEFCAELRMQGVPIVAGYQPPLHGLPAFMKYARACPVAKDLHDRRLFYFENCAWSPTPAQIKLIGEAFKRAAKFVIKHTEMYRIDL